MFKQILKGLAGGLARILPKFRYVYFKGMPSFEDSLVAIYLQLPEARFRKVVWSVYDKQDEPPFLVRGKTQFVRKGSFRDFYYGMVSRYVFTTHGHFIDRIPSNQICVNTWHGMPFKKIGKLNGQHGRIDTLLCATSELFQDIMSRSFGMPIEQTLITGIPRNDLLKSDNPRSVWDKAGIDRGCYDKVFFWLPTFRKSTFGYITEDGVEVDNVFGISDFPVDAFDSFLREHNCLCILKPHPMAPRKNAESTDHILVIDEDWLWSHGLTLYPLVGQTDFLVSDISSIMIDFILLDRPMIVCFPDQKSYEESRGFVFEPIEDWLPAVVTNSYDDLIEEIAKCISGVDLSGNKRRELAAKFHTHQNFNATQRLMNLVFKSE